MPTVAGINPDLSEANLAVSQMEFQDGIAKADELPPDVNDFIDGVGYGEAIIMFSPERELSNTEPETNELQFVGIPTADAALGFGGGVAMLPFGYGLGASAMVLGL